MATAGPIPIQVTTLAELLTSTAAAWEGTALVFPGERLTYPELEAAATEVACGLRALGVEPGDKVALFMPNCADYIVALFAIAKVGAVSVPINGRFKAFELAYVVDHAETRVLLTAHRGPEQDEDFALLDDIFPGLAAQRALSLSLDEARSLRQIVDLGSGSHAGLVGRDEFLRGGRSVSEDELMLLQRRVAVRDPCVLMYTSGTTARPKGCLISHEALVRQARMAAARALQLDAGESMWDPLPLFHTGGIMPLTAVVASRAAFCHPGHFEPGAALEMIERERCAVLYVMFDTIWMSVVEHPRFDSTDLSSVRTVYLATVPERMRAHQERLGAAKVGTAFGMTELCAHLALAGPESDEETRLTTAGPVQPEFEVRVVSPETGEDVPANEIGEILCRGACLFDGYFNAPEATAAAVDARGWFHTGDLGRLDERGRLTFRGRVKDMLKVGGENVSALEVEGFLSQHDAVNIVQVVGAPDARYQEVAAAFVELRAGATATEEELIEYCVGRIATFKVPRYVRFVTEWPMSGTKIQKYVLREAIAAELREHGITEAPRIERPQRSANRTIG